MRYNLARQTITIGHIKILFCPDFDPVLLDTEMEGMCITANGNILASGNLSFRVFNLQLKVIKKNICYLYSVWVNQIN